MTVKVFSILNDSTTFWGFWRYRSGHAETSPGAASGNGAEVGKSSMALSKNTGRNYSRIVYHRAKKEKKKISQQWLLNLHSDDIFKTWYFRALNSFYKNAIIHGTTFAWKSDHIKAFSCFS